MFYPMKSFDNSGWDAVPEYSWEPYTTFRAPFKIVNTLFRLEKVSFPTTALNVDWDRMKSTIKTTDVIDEKCYLPNRQLFYWT